MSESSSANWLPQMLLPAATRRSVVTDGPAYGLINADGAVTHDHAPRALHIECATFPDTPHTTGRIGVVERTLFEDFVTHDDDVIAEALQRPPVSHPEDEPMPPPEQPLPVPFLPARATWYFGIDKPGAVLLHRLRRVDADAVAADGNTTPPPRTSQARPVEVAIRAPQVLAPPSDATLQVKPIRITDGTSGLSTLSIAWTEGCGSVPIGALAPTPVVSGSQFVISDGFPPLALVQRIGDRLIPLSLENPRLLVPTPAPSGRAESMSLYVVCRWDLLTPPGGLAGYTLSLEYGGKELQLDDKKCLTVFTAQGGQDNAGRIYELSGSLFSEPTITKWNFVWKKDETVIGLLSANAAITRTSGEAPEPPRVAAVLRTADQRIDRTLFYGAAASSRGFSPRIEGEAAAPRLTLDAHGSEDVIVSHVLGKAAERGSITIVKYFRDGSTLAAIGSVDAQP